MTHIDAHSATMKKREVYSDQSATSQKPTMTGDDDQNGNDNRKREVSSTGVVLKILESS